MAGRVHPPRHGHSGLTSTGGSGGIQVKDEGTSIGTYSVVNFVGADVSALAGSGQADVYIPAVSYASHWNSSDGDTGNQTVTESITRTTARISTPSGGEGNTIPDRRMGGQQPIGIASNVSHIHYTGGLYWVWR